MASHVIRDPLHVNKVRPHLHMHLREAWGMHRRLHLVVTMADRREALHQVPFHNGEGSS